MRSSPVTRMARSCRRAWWPLGCLLAVALAAPQNASAGDFSVTPTGVELKAGAMSDTITVINHAAQPLRVRVRLFEWTQDAQGKDVYTETADLVYFPRQMEVEPGSRRVIRVGARAAAPASERAYRLFIEEQPAPLPAGVRAQVSIAFRFGVPVFLPPPEPRPQPQALEPTLADGKLSLVVRNGGNRHVRVNSVRVSDGAGFTHQAQGWYTLAGAQQTYSVAIPREACLKARTLNLTLEGAGVRIDRKIDVDPARCG